MLEKEKDKLFHRSQNFPPLMEDLNNYFKPVQESDNKSEISLLNEQYEIKQHKKQAETKASWLKFRNTLIADQSQLSNPDQRLWYIDNLTRWLRLETNDETTKAARQWHLLKQAFSNNIAIAYRDTLKAHWRATKPERPKRKGNNVTTKWSTIYAYAGIGIEADENNRWAILLTQKEAKRASEHACMSEQAYPDWMDDLLGAHPSIVIPIIMAMSPLSVENITRNF